jgi:hypothetical protein
MPTTLHKPEWLDVLNERIKGLRFGKVELVIHQGKVTQFETTEKVRFEPVASPVGDGRFSDRFHSHPHEVSIKAQ